MCIVKLLLFLNFLIVISGMCYVQCCCNFTLLILAAIPSKYSVNGHFYEISDDITTWPDAYLAAKAKGGYLATILSDGENTFVCNLAGSRRYLFGGTDAGYPVNEFHWADGPVWRVAFMK